jgi:hypothetical protein
MSPKPSPFTDLVVPLIRGGVEPADISVFKGIQFAARGDGDQSILFDCYGARKVDWPAASFAGKAKWRPSESHSPASSKTSNFSPTSSQRQGIAL